MVDDIASVKVAVRVRPLLDREKDKRECIHVFVNKNQLLLGKDQSFSFDHVFDGVATQAAVFEEAVKPLVESFKGGYNATVFAYGQTGSGKTYTVEGGSEGIISRAADDIFAFVSTENYDEYTSFEVRVSYLEIYLDEVKDLLNKAAETLNIREDEKGHIVVQGLKEIKVESVEDLRNLMRYGMAVRTTGATLMNEHSSRSHAVLTFYLDKKSSRSARNLEVISSKFHFVDLAGSERANRTGNVGERFKESVHINSGLLALGNVIHALSDPKRRTGHVPYRESKITRLLKDSLGGNSRTLMITCVSPSMDSFEETFNSLKYAKRARMIKNRPIVNKDIIELEMKRMESEILYLREQLKTREKSSSEVSSEAYSDDSTRELTSELNTYKALVAESIKEIKYCIEKKSLNKLSKLLSKLQSRDTVLGSTFVLSSSHDNDDDEVALLRDELEQARADLLNDEKIFADQQCEHEKSKGELLAKIRDLEDEATQLRSDLENVGIEKERQLNRPITTPKLVMSRDKPCTMEDILSLIREKTLKVFESNVQYALRADKGNKNLSPDDKQTVKLISKEKASLEEQLYIQKNINQKLNEAKLKLEDDIIIQKDKVYALEEEVSKLHHQLKGETETTVQETTDKSEMLDKEIMSVLEERKMLKMREEQILLREEAMKEREAVANEIDRIKSKEIRASQVLSKDIIRMSNKLQDIDKEMARKSQSVSKTPSKLSISEITNLKAKKDELKAKIEKLNTKMNSGELLTPADKTRYQQLNETMEVLSTVIDYRKDLISQSSVRSSIPELPVNEVVVKTLFNKLVMTIEETEKIRSDSKAIEAQLAEQNILINDLKSTVLQTSTPSNHGSGDGSSERLEKLEKDVEYYKLLSRDLKSKLRQQSQPPDINLAGSLGKSPREPSELTCLTPVRKSKKDLRPITTEEAFQRTSLNM